MWQTGAQGGDPLGYYTYLPATFLYQDWENLAETNKARGDHLKRKFSENFYEEQFITNRIENGNQVIKYTCGIAMTNTPFFGIAHFLAPYLGYKQDGFSPIYIFFQYLAGFFYALWGLWLVRLILLKWFEDKEVTLALVCIALGTNLYFFVVYHAAMAHATLFFLHAMVLYQTILLYEKQAWKNAIILGIALGLIILIRPVEMIIVLIPLLWGISPLNKTTLNERFLFLKKHQLKIGLVVLFTFLMAIPQFLYWYKLTGNFIYYSYGEEGFDFSKPKIIKGLFGYGNGWLAYTPIMYFALIGLFFIRRKAIALFPFLLFLGIHIYITYSWWCWYYINGLGSRPMVETYGLLSIPLAAYWLVIKQKKWLYYGSIGLALFFTYLNVFQTWQFYKGMLRSEASRLEFYVSTIGKTQLDYEDLILFDCGEWQPDSSDLTLKKRLYFNDFEQNDSLTNVKPPIPYNGNAYKMGTPKKVILVKKTVKELGLKKGDYIKVNAWAMKWVGGARMYSSSLISIRFETPNRKGLKTRRMKMDNKIANPTHSFWGKYEGKVWSEIPFYVHVSNLPEDAVLEVFIQYGSPMAIYLDDLAVEIWRKE
ncbi:MAG: hypothetical protein AB8G86_02590 [Saprospiraceae bacterium]